jgi:acyl-CoA synthetase (AMP-forming)/AMP-acid ligase II
MHTEQTASAGVRLAARALGLTEGDVVWMPSPIGHSTGFNFGVRIAVHFGLPIVLQDRWDALAAAALIERHRVAYTVAATTFLGDLVRASKESLRDLTSLRLFASGGAPVPAALIEQAEALGIPVLRLYGSTELLTVTLNRPDSPRAKRVGSDGRPLESVEVEVRIDGRPVRNEPGEIYARSPAASVGFFNDPERTAAAFDAEGWVATGDLGVVDNAGYLTIVGRKKEIIIRGGLNIAPRELEDLIGELPQVAKVAVVPLPDNRLGEIGCACVVPVAGAALTLDEVLAHLTERGVARYKHPERLEIMDDLPTTATGKVQKHQLVRALTR